jgi:hypothetical protein
MLWSSLMGQIGAETPQGGPTFLHVTHALMQPAKTLATIMPTSAGFIPALKFRSTSIPKVETGLAPMLLEARPPPRFGVRVEA